MVLIYLVKIIFREVKSTKNDPSIVRQLREEEVLGILQSNSLMDYEQQENIDNESCEKIKIKKVFTVDQKDSAEGKNELANVKSRYRTIFDNYSVAITLADNKERIVSWNSYAEELLNKKEQDLYLTPVSSLYPRKSRAQGQWLPLGKTGEPRLQPLPI